MGQRPHLLHQGRVQNSKVKRNLEEHVGKKHELKTGGGGFQGLGVSFHCSPPSERGERKMPRSFSRCDTDGDDGDEDGDSNNNIMDEKGSYSCKEKLKTVTFHVDRICKIYFTASWTIRASSPFGNAERPGRAPGHSTLSQTPRAPTAIRREATCTPPTALLPSPTLRL